MISTQSPLLHCALCKPSELVGLLKTDFKSMLTLGLSFLHVVGAYNIYTESGTWQFVQHYHLLGF